MTDPMTRPMRADARRNYERLVAAARDTFVAEGVDTTLEAVARRADVGIGTLYRHFPTRFDLVAAVYMQDVNALEKTARESVDKPAWDALAGLMSQFVEFGVTKRVLLAELADSANSVSRDSTTLVHCRDVIREAAMLVLTRAQDEGLARRDIEAPDLMRLVGGLALTPNPDPGQLKLLLDVVLDGVRARD
ncbi:MAG: TetR/AcrR family transcriptional regulator [Nocardioidaceae bacterium]